ncbi:ABC transporter permease [Streptomyces sp. NPDC087294]|uniref:ABC transporter permease n=1 Tax=Streptomyces sp. NPDC087294 TaxID=3365777 RepID=UPI0038058802
MSTVARASGEAAGEEATDAADMAVGEKRPGGASDGPGALSARRAVGLVARREINSRMRTKSFVLSTLGLLLSLGVYALIILASDDGPAKVGVGREVAALRPVLAQLAEGQGEFEFVAVEGDGGGDRVERLLRDGDLSAVVGRVDGRTTLAVEHEADENLLAVVRAATAEERTTAELERAGVDPVEFRQRVASATVTVDALDPSQNSAAQQFALIIAATGLLYFFFIFYGIMLAQGVVEEKTSRVVELLLSTIRPWQLLAGKLVGVAVVGLTQLVLLGGAVVALAQGTGTLTLPSTAAGSLVTLVVWFLLGFFLFAALLAAAAARVSRQEDLQGVVQPVMMLISTPFMLGVVLLSKDVRDPVIEWLSLVPLFSPILMPARMLLGLAPLWQIALSLVLAVAALAGMTRVAGRMYANSVLRSGSRVPLTEALRTR